MRSPEPVEGDGTCRDDAQAAGTTQFSKSGIYAHARSLIIVGRRMSPVSADSAPLLVDIHWQTISLQNYTNMEQLYVT
ncbi:hypothetical protein PISMIDRAFT_19496 [Pisolithus microcarpus 441]|uniref:Uncharacterized protein n=1 Tax=Pisolithus microcarpus 441 TaxID=765257 RepID=A0A0C9YC53_9AGAM|nr:hypothetical protein PISMIDRAFT_19496 [Pisolithus microcarpus 441]